MPDHIHVLFKPSRPVSLQNVVANIKRTVLFRCRRKGITVSWQRGFHDRIVREHEKSDEFVKYILMNPVRAGLVQNFSAYPYAGRVDPWF
jgi:REP element-mobilizing transposase RayT